MKWRRCADLPEAMSAPQVVHIGNYVYVGGGYRNPGASKAVFRYDINRDSWTSLPGCPTLQHGLAKLNGKLVAVGGTVAVGGPLTGFGKKTNTVLTFQDNIWQALLPPMPTPRCLPSTSSYDNRLILVAGGIVNADRDGKCARTDAVEIYIKDRQWYRTLHLPFLGYSFSTSIVGDRCYMLGGVASPEDSRTTVYATRTALLENADIAETTYMTLRTLTKWDSLKGKHPLPSSSLVEVDGKLLAFGGEKWTSQTVRGSLYISSYDFATDMWVECKGAQLPVPLYRPGVVKLAEGEVMVIGGERKLQSFSKRVSIGEPLGVFEINPKTYAL